jgi:hypothetical protein
MARLARAFIGAYLFAWIGVSVPLCQMYVLENSWYCQLMAHDPEYIYLTYRSLSHLAPWIWGINFVCGALAGWLHK